MPGLYITGGMVIGFLLICIGIQFAIIGIKDFVIDTGYRKK